MIPSLHRPALTERCLLSLQRSQPASTEIVIVEDDGAAHPEAIYKGPFAPNVRQIVLNGRHGFAGAVNAALAETESDFVLLLNNDIEVAPGFLESLIEALEKNTALAFATAKLMSGKDVGMLDGAGDEMLAGGGAYRIGHQERDQGQYGTERQVLSGCGGATLYRRSTLPSPALNEALFAYLEDVDLALALLLKGVGGIYVPDAVASHLGSATMGDPKHPVIFELITRNQILLLAGNFPLTALLRAAPRIVLFQSLWFLRAVQTRRFLGYVRGMSGALLLLPRLWMIRKARLRNKTMTAAEFYEALLQSEARIYSWQSGLPKNKCSSLLHAYFFFFKPQSN